MLPLLIQAGKNVEYTFGYDEKFVQVPIDLDSGMMLSNPPSINANFQSLFVQTNITHIFNNASKMHDLPVGWTFYVRSK